MAKATISDEMLELYERLESNKKAQYIGNLEFLKNAKNVKKLVLDIVEAKASKPMLVFPFLISLTLYFLRHTRSKIPLCSGPVLTTYGWLVCAHTATGKTRSSDFFQGELAQKIYQALRQMMKMPQYSHLNMNSVHYPKDVCVYIYTQYFLEIL